MKKFCKIIGYPFKIIGMIFLTISFLFSSESWEDTFGRWIDREYKKWKEMGVKNCHLLKQKGEGDD